jgi:branched-chain amino acid aminotransferase
MTESVVKTVGYGEPLAYLNGRFLAQADAHLPLHDAGFVMGATVTDLARTFHFRIFRFADHLARFRQSCTLAYIPLLLDDDQLTAIAERLVEHNKELVNPEADLAVLVFATPGAVGYYHGEPGGVGDAAPTLGMHTFPLPFGRYRGSITDGATLTIAKVLHVPAASVDRRIKHRSRLHWWIADREAHKQSAVASPLLLDENGHVTETAAANFLLVKGDTVLSPPLDTILGGISLQVTRELCDRLGVLFCEKPLSVAECLEADEAMLTSTPYGVAPVSKLDQRTYPAPGPMARRLMAAWDEIAGTNIRQQILANP